MPQKLCHCNGWGSLPAMAVTAAGTISTAAGAAGSALSAGFAVVRGVAALSSAGKRHHFTPNSQKDGYGANNQGIIGEMVVWKWLKDLGEEGKKLTKKGKKLSKSLKIQSKKS